MSKPEILTEEVRGLINYHPHWIIRRGNLFFFLILCGIFGITWCIRVPSSLSGPMQTGEKNGQPHAWIKTTRDNAAELRPGEIVTIRLSASMMQGSIASVPPTHGTPGAKDSCLIDIRLDGKTASSFSAPATVLLADQSLARRFFDRLHLFKPMSR